MPKVNLLSKEWCNLVFERRNKDYGAYVLRRNAGKSLTCALVVVVSTFLLVAVLPLVLIRWEISKIEKDAISTIANLSKLDPPKVEKLHELKAVDLTQRVRATKMKDAMKFVPEISDDEAANTQLMPGTDETGASDEQKATISVPDNVVAPDSDKSAPTISPDFPSPVEVVEEMPQFPGGLAALMKWLDKNIVYPPVCIRNKVEGRVEVSFLVDTDGSIVEPQITKKLHPLLDREALLAVKKMPAWIPGKSNGRISIVRVTIPIEFAAQ